MSTNLIERVELTHITLDLKITGEAPLLMHAPSLVDPLHPIKRDYDKITAKGSKKTIADNERLSRLEWEAGLYHDDDIGPFLSAVNVKQALRAAAGRYKLGAPLVRGVTFAQTKIPIEYDGPRDRDGLYEAGYRDTRNVRNGGMNRGSVMRTRPCFPEWSLSARLFLNPHEIGIEDFARCVADAQRYGIGDYRPEFGLFSAELYEVDEEESK